MVREALPSSLFGTGMAPAVANCLPPVSNILRGRVEGLLRITAVCKDQDTENCFKTGCGWGGRYMESDKDGGAGHSSCFVLFFGLSSG